MTQTKNLVDNPEVNVDRSVENPQNLADFLKTQLLNINNIFKKYPTPTVTYKADHSPVTHLDLALSDFIEELMMKHLPHSTFYSEEKFSDWKFPLLALDPLDGTREYIDGNPEWAISIGYFQTEKFQGEGWVYNPAKNELFDQAQIFPFTAKKKFRGEVSRSEWKKGLYSKLKSEKFEVVPVGSIAYKLARLSKGECDFVVSLLPKNIWDIAGGSLLCQKAGLKFYSQGKEVTEVKQLYQPPLIWAHEENLPELLKLFGE